MRNNLLRKGILMLTLAAGISLNANAQVWDGTTTTEPSTITGGDFDGWYNITNGAELAWVAAQSNTAVSTAKIYIANDIDLGGHKWIPIGLKQYFNGAIEGANHTITGLCLVPSDTDDCCGLVGKTNSTSVNIKNLSLEGVMTIDNATKSSVSNTDYASLIGLINACGTIENVHSAVDINATRQFNTCIGGLVARSKAVQMINCSYSGTITIDELLLDAGGGTIGGLIGLFSSTSKNLVVTMKNCCFIGNIIYNATNNIGSLAGLAGRTNFSGSGAMCTISGCYVAGKIVNNGGSTIKNYSVLTYPQAGCTWRYVNPEDADDITNTNFCVGFSSDSKYHGTIVTEEQYHNGHLAYAINSNLGKAGMTTPAWGHDLSVADGRPVAVNADNRVFKTKYIVEEDTYATIYNNATLRLPEVPVKDGYDFIGWFDNAENGNQYTESTAISTDLTLYAQFSKTTGLSTHYTLHSTHSYNIAGQRVNANAKGFVISNGRKYLKK